MANKVEIAERNEAKKEMCELIVGALMEKMEFEAGIDFGYEKQNVISVWLGDIPVQITVAVPTGTRNGDGTVEPHDCTQAWDDYAYELEEKMRKAAETAEKKAKKKAIDEANRKKKAELAAVLSFVKTNRITCFFFYL